MTEQDLLFSMDIGTRTVVGIVGYHDGQKFKILASEVEEHKERAMYDGQVHDIELVARAAGQVKERLEKKLNVELKRVAVAAAGRSLKTCKVFVEKDADPAMEIERELVSALEIEGIQQAQKEIERMQHEEDVHYYCVGYAVVNYFLNGSVIGNPEGHRGKRIGLEVLATFLPRMVVDSLYSVVGRIGLEVSSLTLEPIAAMNVSIHSNLRLLNIALVDIGAGTSDIALTKSGTVYAFAMAPIAGDEITEKIAENYLLDFDTAEQVKVSLSKGDSVKFIDIMGLAYEKSSEEILKSIEPAITMLAGEIASKIVEYNGKQPSAVFLIGGGSQIPTLAEAVAHQLQLPVERVGVRKTDIIRDVEIESENLEGPEFITPIGIAITAHINRQKDFLQVSVNGSTVKLFNSKTLTVADALILVGYSPRNLIGRRGVGISFTLNGSLQMAKGEPGEAARIFVNGVKAGLDRPIVSGDRIEIDPAVDGKPGTAYVRDYVKEDMVKNIELEGKVVTAPFIRVNGSRADMEAPIKDGDEVVIQALDKIIDVVRCFGIELDRARIFLNDREASMEDVIYENDRVHVEIPPTDGKAEDSESSVQVEVRVNGNSLMVRGNRSKMLFLDIFNHIQMNPKTIKGRIEMLLNGKTANYTDVLKNGDKIEIKW